MGWMDVVGLRLVEGLGTGTVLVLLALPYSG